MPRIVHTPVQEMFTINVKILQRWLIFCIDLDEEVTLIALCKEYNLEYDRVDGFIRVFLSRDWSNEWITEQDANSQTSDLTVGQFMVDLRLTNRIFERMYEGICPQLHISVVERTIQVPSLPPKFDDVDNEIRRLGYFKPL